MMRMTSLALICAATLAGSSFAGSMARAQTVPPAITVSGEATISVAPDRAEIDGGVTSEAKTSRLSLQPQQSSRNPNGPVQITGYRASNRVTLTLRDVTKIASAIDTLVGAGANEISGISFSVAQASKLLDDARSQAIADAQRKAEIYAKAANVTLGAPLSISEEGAPGPVPMYARKMS